MFSQGQITFGVLFFIFFVIGIIWAYRKDIKKNTSYFKGSYKVLLFVIVVFIAMYGVVKLKQLLAS